MTQKVTVYTPCRHYGRFLAQAIESVLAQTFQSWELILVDDGSEDETAQVARQFAQAHPERIRLLSHAVSKGLPACANTALEEARGEYVMRLDPDDVLDENALLVLSTYLDQHPETALVFPNYFYMDAKGKVLGVENRKKIGRESQLLDLPAHGACTLVRRRVLKNIGGYSEKTDRQDGYELWLQVFRRWPVANVTTPLFYYRQHEDSVSQDPHRILSARGQIKRYLAERLQGRVRPRTIGIIPAKNSYRDLPDIVLKPFAGRPLVDWTLEEASRCAGLDTLLVTTDDLRVIQHCEKQWPSVLTCLRPPELSDIRVWTPQILHHAVAELEEHRGIFPDVLVLLSLHTPLRRAEHIQKALDTLQLIGSDSVISVYEDYALHFLHQENGLEPINPAMHRKIRLEREALYVDNGALKVFWRDGLQAEEIRSVRTGHIVMSESESGRIRSPADLPVVEQALQRRLEGQARRATDAFRR